MIEVAEKDMEFIKQVLKKYVPHAEVRAFGSRVDGRAKPYSDLDLAIVTAEKIDRGVLVKLKEAFQESKLPFRIDIMDWERVSKNFQDIISMNYVVIQD